MKKYFHSIKAIFNANTLFKKLPALLAMLATLFLIKLSIVADRNPLLYSATIRFNCPVKQS